MAESFEAGNVSRSTDTVPLVPSSSSEVVIRTMASDLEAMGQSGGLPMSGALASPATFSAPAGSMPTPAPQAAPVSGGMHGVRIVLVTVAIGVAALALFALGFYVIPALTQ